MEIIVDLGYLCEVLLLHLASCFTLATILLRIREQDLVNHYIMNVDFLLGEFNRQSFCFIHTQELRDANSNEGGLVCILELFIDLFNLGFHSIYAIEKSLLHILRICSLLGHHCLHLTHHSSKLVFKLYQL